jgi:hypothetical protein
MRYSVDWSTDAQQQLAAIWVEQVSHRRIITTAQAQIDRLLKSDPLGNGTLLSEELYAIAINPLRAVYELSDEPSVVRVVSGKWFPHRKEF